MSVYAQWFLRLTILLTFALINLGGLVHNTGSSLACPDWPLCFGMVMPPMEGGVLIEHSHRLLASWVGFSCVTLFLYSFFYVPVYKRVATLALSMVIVQGLLGGLTVILRLPTLVSTLHLSLSMIFFLTLLYWDYLICEAQRKSEATEPLPPAALKNFQWFRSILGFLFIILYSQIVLGASLRHLGLGASCGLGSEHSFFCFDVINNIASHFFSFSKQAQIHGLHRYFGALVSSLFLIWSIGFYIWFRKSGFSKSKDQTKKINKFSFYIGGMVLIQFSLGVLTVSSHLGIYTTMLHLGGAAFLLALVFRCWLALKSLDGQTRSSLFSSQTWFDFLSLTKPRLSSLVMLTALLGMSLAAGDDHLKLMSVLPQLLGLNLVVAGACGFNCLIEIDVDAKMHRTANRPLPTGRIVPGDAFLFSLLLTFIGFILLWLVSNMLVLLLALIAWLSYVLIYTPMKKYSSFSLYIGALPGAIPPLIGQVAVSGEITMLGVFLFAILFVWQIPHFAAISYYHLKDYERAGLKIISNQCSKQVLKGFMVFTTVLLVLISLATILTVELTTFEQVFFAISQWNWNNSALNLYFVFGSLLGFLFIGLSLRGFWIKEDLALRSWSRHYFLASIIYLPLQLISLAVLA